MDNEADKVSSCHHIPKHAITVEPLQDAVPGRDCKHMLVVSNIILKDRPSMSNSLYIEKIHA